jgi:hypothetical protein
VPTKITLPTDKLGEEFISEDLRMGESVSDGQVEADRLRSQPR